MEIKLKAHPLDYKVYKFKFVLNNNFSYTWVIKKDYKRIYGDGYIRSGFKVDYF